MNIQTIISQLTVNSSVTFFPRHGAFVWIVLGQSIPCHLHESEAGAYFHFNSAACDDHDKASRLSDEEWSVVFASDEVHVAYMLNPLTRSLEAAVFKKYAHFIKALTDYPLYSQGDALEVDLAPVRACRVVSFQKGWCDVILDTGMVESIPANRIFTRNQNKEAVLLSYQELVKLPDVPLTLREVLSSEDGVLSA